MASGKEGGSMLKRGWERISRRRKRRDDELTRRQSSQVDEHDLEVARDAIEANANRRSLVHRGMDRIRRSFRQSFRRHVSRDRDLRADSPAVAAATAAEQSPSASASGGAGTQSATPSRSRSNANGSAGGGGGASGKAEMWQPDEAAVREGTCSFNVKYLGGVEVFESRGMQVCEGALKLLRTQRRRPLKAVLYVSGDGLRVVDQESNRGLIVDQTIEKVSFCAPDRNHEKGFAYICRDGTSRRWMCHGFHATKESGERLSHAVGCAFAVCLERKKKRDAEAALAVQAAAGLVPPTGDATTSSSAGFTLNTLTTTTAATSAVTSVSPSKATTNSFDRTNTALHGSFRRQLSITERLQDPQTAILQEPPPTSSAANNLHITPKPRPLSNPLLFERQGSLRAPDSSSAAAAAFRRQFSLRSYSADSAASRNHFVNNLSLGHNEPIIEGDEETTSWPETSVLTQFGTLPNSSSNSIAFNDFSGTRSSFTAPSSLHNGIVDKCGSLSATQSPLRVVTNQMPTNSAPMSWNDNLSTNIVGGSTSTRSRADEWLEKTLRSSLSLGSPVKAADVQSKVCPPPDHPPPPLPPNIHSSTGSRNSSITHSEQIVSPIKQFDSDFSHYELPPITEAFTSTTDTLKSMQSTANTSNNIDVFGQPVFNPLPEQMNGSMNGTSTICSQEIEGECDPFDVKWSELAISSSSSFPHNPPIKSTNPFYNESSAVKIS